MSDHFWMLAELAAAKETVNAQAKEIAKLRREVSKLRKATDYRWVSVADGGYPPDGEWCWLDGAAFMSPMPAKRCCSDAGGRTPEDTFGDFAQWIERWCLIPKPPAAEGAA